MVFQSLLLVAFCFSRYTRYVFLIVLLTQLRFRFYSSYTTFSYIMHLSSTLLAHSVCLCVYSSMFMRAIFSQFSMFLCHMFFLFFSNMFLIAKCSLLGCVSCVSSIILCTKSNIFFKTSMLCRQCIYHINSPYFLFS